MATGISSGNGTRIATAALEVREYRAMKTYLFILATTIVACFSTAAVAQEADEQEACTGDVLALCSDAIPDRGRITICLRKHWSEVSHDCRVVLANYGRRHVGDQKDRSRGDSNQR